MVTDSFSTGKSGTDSQCNKSATDVEKKFPLDSIVLFGFKARGDSTGVTSARE